MIRSVIDRESGSDAEITLSISKNPTKVVAIAIILVATLVSSRAAAQKTSSGYSVPLQEIRAQLSAVRQTILSSEIPGVITAIHVREADRYVAGQVLVELDCDMQQAQLERAVAEQSSADSLLKANNRLNELNSIGRLEVELAESAKMRADADVRIQEVLLKKCRIIAPFSGVVAAVLINLREYVQPGQPMIDVFDDSELELEFIVPSVWLMNLKNGSQFEVRIDETAKRYHARFKRIGVRADAVSQTISVAAEIIDADPDLVAGMSGTVYLSPN